MTHPARVELKAVDLFVLLVVPGAELAGAQGFDLLSMEKR